MDYAHVDSAGFVDGFADAVPADYPDGWHLIDWTQPTCLDTEYLEHTGYALDGDGVVRPTYIRHTFTAEQIAAMAPEPRIRDWEFRDRFSEAELMAIVGAAYAGDDMARFVLLKIQTASDGVNLDSPEVVGGLDYLTAAGILAPDRKAAILA